MTTQISSLGLLGIPFPYRTIAAKAAAVVAVSGGKTSKKQWYHLPNGVRVYATSEKYARLVAQHEIAKKKVTAEPVTEEAAPELTSPASDMPKGPDAVIPAPVPPAPQAPAVLLEAPESASLGIEPDLSPITTAIAAQSLETRKAAVAQAHKRAEEQANREAQELRIAAEKAETDRRRRLMAEEEEIVINMLLAA